MAAAASTPGIFFVRHQQFEQQRDLTPCQDHWHNLRQPRARKRAAVDAKAVGDARRAAPASTTPATSPATGRADDTNPTLFSSALRVVMAGRGGERWLESTLELQRVCFEACKHCRELVLVRLLVSKSTPEHLWKQGANATAWRAQRASSSPAPGYGGGSGSGGSGESDVCSDISDDCGSDGYNSDDCGSGFGYDSGSDVASEFSSVSGSGGRWEGQPFGWGWQRSLQRPRSGLGYSLSLDRELPAPRIAGMVWERPTMADVSFGSDLAEIAFGPTVIEPLHGVAWTPGLKKLTLSSNWNLPAAAAAASGGSDMDASENWPPLLEELFFGKDFTHPVDGIAFPPSLRHLAFGAGFNHGVDFIAWPPALKSLAFGWSFNQSVERVTWPASVQQLSFGVSFDQPVAGVAWPAPLRRLTFGYRFDQAVAGVVWPSCLQSLSFGHDFNQPLAGVAWPVSLKELTFGFEFVQPIAGVALPASLEKLTFGYCFNQPIAGAAWPASLQQLTFGGMFNHPFDDVVWPASLRRLTLGYGFMQSVEKGMWPAGLCHLSVDSSYPLSRSSLPNGVRVELT